jgi:hypothetical protein
MISFSLPQNRQSPVASDYIWDRESFISWITHFIPLGFIGPVEALQFSAEILPA